LAGKTLPSGKKKSAGFEPAGLCRSHFFSTK
jgi:hypothetical protein